MVPFRNITRRLSLAPPWPLRFSAVRSGCAGQQSLQRQASPPPTAPPHPAEAAASQEAGDTASKGYVIGV